MGFSTWGVRYVPFTEKLVKATCEVSHKAFYDYVENEDLNLYEIDRYFNAGEDYFTEAQTMGLTSVFNAVEKDMAKHGIDIEFLSTDACGDVMSGEEYEGFIVDNKKILNPAITKELHALLTESEFVGGG